MNIWRGNGRCNSLTFGDLIEASTRVIADLERKESVSLRGWEGEWKSEKDLSCHGESPAL